VAVTSTTSALRRRLVAQSAKRLPDLGTRPAVSSEETQQRPADQSAQSDSAPDLASAVERYEDAPDECTIYPVGVSEDELVTTWITAREEHFVALEAMR
jgi:hypothetical protein